MNTLGTVMGGCWRGRMGLESEMALAIHQHYAGVVVRSQDAGPRGVA